VGERLVPTHEKPLIELTLYYSKFTTCLGFVLKLDFVGAKPPQNQVFRRVLKHALDYTARLD
jgi:hypothetical protein